MMQHCPRPVPGWGSKLARHEAPRPREVAHDRCDAAGFATCALRRRRRAGDEGAEARRRIHLPHAHTGSKHPVRRTARPCRYATSGLASHGPSGAVQVPQNCIARGEDTSSDAARRKALSFMKP